MSGTGTGTAGGTGGTGTAGGTGGTGGTGTAGGTGLSRLVGECASALVAGAHAFGVVAGAVRGQERVLACHGRTARDGGRPVGQDTLFEVGSLTKTFTALLLAELVTAGEVGYADRLPEYLPAHAAPRDRLARTITLADLATHTAGLPRLPRNFYRRCLRHWLTDPYAHYRRDDLYRATAGLRLRRPPGEQVRYSTFGVGLLGQLLANAAGGDYHRLVTARVCAPLGMRHSTADPTPDTLERTARGHRRGRPRPHWRFDALAGAGAMCCSGADLLRYLDAHVHPASTPLSMAVRDTHQPRRPSRTGHSRVCLGWQHRVVRGRTLIWHTGGTAGFAAFVGFSPDAGAGVLLLANAAPTPRQPVLRAARRLLGEVVFA